MITRAYAREAVVVLRNAAKNLREGALLNMPVNKDNDLPILVLNDPALRICVDLLGESTHLLQTASKIEASITRLPAD